MERHQFTKTDKKLLLSTRVMPNLVAAGLLACRRGRRPAPPELRLDWAQPTARPCVSSVRPPTPPLRRHSFVSTAPCPIRRALAEPGLDWVIFHIGYQPGTLALIADPAVK